VQKSNKKKLFENCFKIKSTIKFLKFFKYNAGRGNRNGISR